MKSRKKLNAKTIAAIKKARDEGRTYDQIAADFKVSQGTVRNALTAKVKAGPVASVPLPASALEDVPSEPLPPVDEAAQPTNEEIRGFIARQMRTITREIDECDDPGQRVTLNRTLSELTKLLARITPAPAMAPEENPDFLAARERARSAFAVLVEQAVAK